MSVKLQRIPEKLLVGESVPHAIYAVAITPKTTIPSEKYSEIEAKLKSEIPKNVRGCIVKDVSISPTKIVVTVTGSPFAFGALLPFLPQIMTLIGIAIAFIAVYFVVSAIPTWAYALGAIAILAIVVMPKYLPKFK